MTPARLLAALVPLVVLAACGGESFRDVDDDDGGEGGSSAGRGGGSKGGSGNRGGSDPGGSGGTGTGGTGTGGTGTAGTAGTGTAGSAGSAGSGQCLAFPTCLPGERQVPDPSYCLPGEPCIERSICGFTIWCTSPVQCTAVPVCDEGDTPLMGPCPPDASCYERTVCGSTLWCLDLTCDPETEYNRQYLFSSCNVADWPGCTLPNTTVFENECGCGCEQDPLCPQHLGCYVAGGPLPADSAPAEAPANPAPGSAGAGPGMAPPPIEPCDPELVARCPFSEYYVMGF
ncbi:MAG TPA: hypothetical protein VGK73_27320 [Polyangiaceae bacterium]